MRSSKGSAKLKMCWNHRLQLIEPTLCFWLNRALIKSRSSCLPVCMWCDCCREKRMEMKYHVINSWIPPPPSSPAHPAIIFVCRAKRTSVRLHVQRMSSHPPFLEIDCAERGLKIDPPLITVSLKYLRATATIKRHSLSLGFYNPYRVPVFCGGDSHYLSCLFWINLTPVLSTWIHS